MFKYKVKDDDGDVSFIRFDFDFNNGRIIMEPEMKQLIAVKGYGIPTIDDLVESFLRYQETGEMPGDDDDDENVTHKTLLVMLVDEWCDNQKLVQQATSVFDASLKMSYSVSAMRALSERLGDDDVDENSFPAIRSDGAKFLWDTFVYVHEQGIALNADPERRADVEDAVRKETGHKEFSLGDAMPKSLGCWALPVKIFNDQEYIVIRVPYDVMEDLYDEWKHHRKEQMFDGSALDGGLPTDITEEINALFRKFNKDKDEN